VAIFEQLNALRAQRNALFASANTETDPAKLTDIRDQIKALNDQISAAEEISQQMAGSATPAATGEPDKTLTDVLKSNEYARAFAYAVRNGVTPKKGRGDEKCKVLYDALTIAGGDPAGEDGGFLVPEDIDHTIRELKRAFNPLSALFSVENTNTNTGWRVTDVAPTVGFTALDSEIPSGGIAEDDQPEFAKITYSLKTYGLIIPVSNELAADEVANLFAYLARWMAKKDVLTENAILKGKLELLSASNILTTDDPVAKIKEILNTGLDPAISASATILTNQSGFNYLDQMTDGMGRPLLQPDPATGTPMMFKNRPVVMMSDALFPNRVVTTAGATKGTYYPIYLGDFKQYATMFQRQRMEVRATDIGGNAWKTNSVEVRAIARKDASVFDSGAVLRREIFIPA
jgi:HK97 family phage major capsid protein